MIFNNADLYPTPDNLCQKLIEDINFYEIKNILEPQAGTAKLALFIADKLNQKLSYRYSKKDYKYMIDCIEIDEELRPIIKEKGFKVVHDDFLTFNTYKHYDLIVCNVPFSTGDKHLLKAINLLENNNGGKLRAICNAETIRNTYSNNRKLLQQKLEQYKASIEFIQDGFKDAERKTNVEIAIIKLDIESNNSSILLDALKRAEQEETIVNDSYEVGEQQDFIKAICMQYNEECKAVKRLIDEFNIVSKISLKSFNEESSDSILSLNVSGINEALEIIRLKYWKTLFQSDKMRGLMTQNIRTQWESKMDDLKYYDFTPWNIERVQIEIKSSLTKGIEETILKLFDEFTKYNMDDGKNIHMFTGWKTNSAFKIENKVILPYFNMFDTWSGKPEYQRAYDRLKDIEKVFTYIDKGVLQMDHVDLEKALKFSFKYGETKNIECTYFTLDFYKKGTCHIKFNDKYKKVLDRFNYVCCHLKGWLPNSYGKKSYKDMTEQEKEIVKAYVGSEKQYNEDISKNPDLYNFDMNSMLLMNE